MVYKVKHKHIVDKRKYYFIIDNVLKFYERGKCKRIGLLWYIIARRGLIFLISDKNQTQERGKGIKKEKLLFY